MNDDRLANILGIVLVVALAVVCIVNQYTQMRVIEAVASRGLK